MYNYTKMKKVIFLLFFLMCASGIYLAQSHVVFASNCNFKISPSSGPVGTEFIVTIENCNPPNNTLGDYVLNLYNEAGDDLATYQVGVGPSATVTISTLADPGIYSVRLFSLADLDIPGQGTIIVTENEPVEPPLQCGDVAPPNADNCSDAITQNCCPFFCPAIPVGNGVWKCSGTSGGDFKPYMCAVNGTGIGINSAIGCIPIEDVNETTAFFVRWALGIGGGIALFLIATSAIKIMTTKGDPKRLQDARDTLSSAIAGIVLIVLSVFFIRFLSETLLGLF